MFGEDPTVNRLQEMAAERMGKEAAVRVLRHDGQPGGLLTHCGRGDEVILGDQAHTFLYEAGGVAAVGGIHVALLPNQPDGTLDAGRNARPPSARTISTTRAAPDRLENTHNRCGGAAITPEYTASSRRRWRTRAASAPHLDGARIFNAAVALGVAGGCWPARRDSVTFCLSKGLCGAGRLGPVRLQGLHRRGPPHRKLVGGGMRQAGVLAAAGIVALEQMVDRLAEDHANARLLAEAMPPRPACAVDLARVQTWIMVYFDLDFELPIDAGELRQRAEQQSRPHVADRRPPHSSRLALLGHTGRGGGGGTGDQAGCR